DNSSLGTMSNHIGQRIDAQGPASLALKITIPQHVPHPHTHVEGALAFGGNTLSTSGVPPLSALRGSVRFTEAGASLHALSGRFLGGPVRANGTFR
ncbi:YhdP family protein, partial [Burkholderia sola]